MPKKCSTTTYQVFQVVVEAAVVVAAAVEAEVPTP